VESAVADEQMAENKAGGIQGLNESSPPLPSRLEERAARPPCAALLVFAAFVSAELNERAKEKDLTNTHGGRTCPRRPSQYILAVMLVI